MDKKTVRILYGRLEKQSSTLPTKKPKDIYSVNVGNIGNIEVSSLKEAKDTYKEYVEQSKSGYGRASGESVCIFKNGELMDEYDYIGANDNDIQEPIEVEITEEDYDNHLDEIYNEIAGIPASLLLKRGDPIAYNVGFLDYNAHNSLKHNNHEIQQ